MQLGAAGPHQLSSVGAIESFEGLSPASVPGLVDGYVNLTGSAVKFVVAVALPISYLSESVSQAWWLQAGGEDRIVPEPHLPFDFPPRELEPVPWIHDVHADICRQPMTGIPVTVSVVGLG